MAVADTVVVDGGEAETGPKGAIGMEAPLAEVPVPPCLHFADEHNLLALDVDTHAQEIPSIGAGVEDGFGGRVAEPETRNRIAALRLYLTLLPLPIPVRSASVAVVLHIEDRNMGAVEHAFAPVIHITQFDAGPVGSGRCRGPHRQEPPEHLAALSDRDPGLASGPAVNRWLPGIQRRAAERIVPRAGTERSAFLKALHAPAQQFDRYDLSRRSRSSSRPTAMSRRVVPSGCSSATTGGIGLNTRVVPSRSAAAKASCCRSKTTASSHSSLDTGG